MTLGYDLSDFMKPRRLILIIVMTLPTLAFWINIGAWFNQLYGPGENWTGVMLYVWLNALSFVFFLLCVVAAIVMKIKKRDSIDWRTAALINLTPAVGFVLYGYFFLR